MFSTRKLNVIFEKNSFENFKQNFRKKNRIFAYSIFVINGKRIFGIANETP